MTGSQTFAIVGAGLAGAKAAETLRAEGFNGRVVLIGAEAERPYERPPLSKAYVQGQVERDTVFVHEPGFYADRDIDLRISTRAVALDAGSRELVLSDGERLRFDRLLLATGAEPRRLAAPGAELEGIHYLRDLPDADGIAAAFARGGSLVVVGAGWIGAEIAASARQRGLAVTMIGREQVPLERVLGPELGAFYGDLHREHDVDLVLGTDVEAFEGEGRVERVRTTDGRTLACDLVVVGAGAVPRLELARGAGLALAGGGVAVDACLETSMPGIYAAGDVASHRHPHYGIDVRVEHWANALGQGPAAALNMLGRADPYDAIPYFFSDQYDVGMEYAGYAPRSDRVVYRGDPATREFIAFWLDGGRVVAGMNVNTWDVTDQIRALIRAGGQCDVARLTDPDVPLAELTEPARRPA
jgi:3-phenylpropionate/trans-cinnamate dioxygenase ferredoxin reductase subunit